MGKIWPTFDNYAAPEDQNHSKKARCLQYTASFQHMCCLSKFNIIGDCFNKSVDLNSHLLGAVSTLLLHDVPVVLPFSTFIIWLNFSSMQSNFQLVLIHFDSLDVKKSTFQLNSL